MSEEYNQEGFVTPFGRVLGVFQGVEGRSNGSDEHFSGIQNFENGVYTGFKYQCVEYARRWLLSKGLEFHSVPMAAHIWNIKFLERTSDKKPTTIRKVANGSEVPPVPEAIIIWKRASDVPFGHIAVITEVSVENGYVRIAEQNMQNDYWPGNYARELKLEVENGRYWIRDEDELYGWMVVNFDVDGQDPAELVNIEKAVTRHVVENPRTGQARNELEEKFDRVWKERYDSKDKTSFYTIEAHLAYKIKYATMESSFFVMRSTNKIVNDPELYSKFNLPDWLFEYIKASYDNFWNGDGKILTTRIEFGIKGRHIKLLRVLPDTLEGLAESSYFQDVISERLNITVGNSPQSEMYKELIEHVKDSIKGFVHILTKDRDSYLVAFMQQVLSEAGREHKVITTQEFRDSPQGFVDKDGQAIKYVWKTFTWIEALQGAQAPGTSSKVQLVDLLLSNQVVTFEPVWKVLASSPAILPVIYQLFTDHAYVRAADWTISEKLAGKELEEVKFTSGGQEMSYFIEKFERESFDGHQPIVESWNLTRRLSGFGFYEEGEERLPVYCTRIINDD